MECPVKKKKVSSVITHKKYLFCSLRGTHLSLGARNLPLGYIPLLPKYIKQFEMFKIVKFRKLNFVKSGEQGSRRKYGREKECSH